MYTKFDELLKDLGQARPTERKPEGMVFFFNDQPVQLLAGEMEGIHWVDIHIELRNFSVDSLQAAKKVLQANREMGSSTPIPTWFAINEKTDRLIFINRLDWRHISCKVLEDHIQRCIDQMGQALRSEGV
jgi:hypothetical protein